MAAKRTAEPVRKKKKGGTGKNRNTSARKQTKASASGISGNRNTGSSVYREETGLGNRLRIEIFFWIMVALAAILLIGLFGMGGKAGALERKILFGMFGVVAFFVPILLGYSLFLISGKCSGTIRGSIIPRVLGCVLFLIFASAFARLFWETGSHMNARQVFDYCADNSGGCGVVGYGIGVFLQVLVGKIGSGILLLALCIICLVAITQISFMDILRKAGLGAHKRVSGKVNTAKQVRAERRERMRRESTYEDDEEEEDEEEAETTHSRTHLRFMSDEEDLEDTFRSRPALRRPRTPRETVDDDDFFTEIPEREPVLKERPEKAKKERPTASKLSGKERKGKSRRGAESGFLDLPGQNGEDDFLDPPASFLFADNPLMMEEQETNAVTEEQVPKRKRRSTQASRQEAKKEERKVERQVERIQKDQVSEDNYRIPPIGLLAPPSGNTRVGISNKEKAQTIELLQNTMDSFGIGAKVINCSCGPTVTRYELQPEQGVKVSKIVGIQDDIKLALAATDIRMEAPIPGKSAIGIEVPNANNSTVVFRELLESREFLDHKSKIAIAVGKDLEGKPVIADIAKMPHLLIAGATGSGKSVCINSIIMSILYKAKPSEVKMIMIDPKVVELSVYNGIPHLLIPVVTDPKKATGALNWAVSEMTNRYEKFAEMEVRDLAGYNRKAAELNRTMEEKIEIMPQIVVIVDELADLMMVASGEVEDAICRLAQLARAAGMHLIIATQRPSVKVITGLIKANMPSRIAFAVTSFVDSRTILDKGGAEKLLGKGDMLFYPQGYPKPARVQGAFVSDDDVQKVVAFLKENSDGAAYSSEIQNKVDANATASAKGKTAGGAMEAGGSESGSDEYYAESARLIVGKEKASIGMLQRAFKIGFNRAARIMEQLEKDGIVSPEDSTKPRKVLMEQGQLEEFLSTRQQ